MKNRWKSALFCIVSIFFTLSAFASETGKIVGVVLDKETKEPISGANVYIEGTEFKASTDKDGRFAIPFVPFGDYNLTAGTTGYKPSVKNNVTISCQTSIVEFLMERDYHRILDIELELVYKKEFDNLLVGPKKFPPPEIKKVLEQNDIPKEDKEWLLNALRIEIARREKVFYTNDGKAIKLPEDLKSIITSKNLKYVIAYAGYIDNCGYTEEEIVRIRKDAENALKKKMEWHGKYQNADEKEKEKFKKRMRYWGRLSDSLHGLMRYIARNRKEHKRLICMETEIGKILWESKDMELPSNLSNDGKIVVAVPGYYFITCAIFYDEKGNEKKKVEGLYGPKGCHDMSADGEMFCAITRINREDTSVMAVAAYNRDGNQLWITELPGTWPRTGPCIAVSPNHKYVAATLWGVNWVREAYTFLINEKGVVTNTYNCATYIPGFSFDDKYLILRADRDTMYFIRTNDGKIIWQKHTVGHTQKRPVVAKNGRAIFFISRVGGHYPDCLWDGDGNIVWQGIKGMKELKEAVGLSPNGYFFVPSTTPEVIIYKIHFNK